MAAPTCTDFCWRWLSSEYRHRNNHFRSNTYVDDAPIQSCEQRTRARRGNADSELVKCAGEFRDFCCALVLEFCTEARVSNGIGAFDIRNGLNSPAIPSSIESLSRSCATSEISKKLSGHGIVGGGTRRGFGCPSCSPCSS